MTLGSPAAVPSSGWPVARAGAPLLAVASGVALLLAHPPVGLWWTTFLHAPLLLASVWAAGDDARPRTIAGLGALAGASCFGPLIGWIAAPAGWIGWGLLVGVQVAWLALLALLLWHVREHRLVPILGAVLFTGIDAWRGIVPFNGFEWGAIAYAHVDSWMLPVARVLGARGITLLTVLSSLAALVVVRELIAIRGAVAQHGLPHRPIAMLVGALLAAALLVSDPPEPTGSIDVLVAQGHDVRFWEESVGDLTRTVTTNLRDDTLAAIGDGPAPDLVVWPESSVDRDPSSTAGAPLGPLVDEVAAAAGELIAGTTLDGPDPRANRYVAASRYVGGLDEVERYVKRRLVPFGEYVPLRPLIGWFPPLQQVPRDAIPGDAPMVMHTTHGARVAVVICFETLFTDIVRGNVLADDEPAQLVLTLTNDASFRDTAEPAQHLAQSRLRAVETGRWVVHAALSGASAFVDPEGRVHDETEVFTRATIRRDVPLVEGRTPYLVVGDVVGWTTRLGVLALGGMLAWDGRTRRPRGGSLSRR